MDPPRSPFSHLPQYRIVVCTSCRVAIVPSQAGTHWQKQHPQTEPAQCREIVRQIEGIPDIAH